MKIRILTQADWKIWKQLRLEALQNAPESFGSSYEEELNWSDLDFQNELNKSDIFGVVLDTLLISCAGFYSLKSSKTSHRGVVWGMYTRPEYRGQGVASALIQEIIKHAKTRVTQLHLTCVTSNFEAMTFYQKQGFKIYGTEPCALKIGDAFFDEYLMVLDLTKEHTKTLVENKNNAMYQVIYDLELSLLDPVIRQSTEQMDKLIADDFIEFGKSGCIYCKHDCLELNEKFRKFIVQDFEVSELSKDVMLATYNSIEFEDEVELVVLRSSIWKRYGEDWRIVFHQGTKTMIDND